MKVISIARKKQDLPSRQKNAGKFQKYTPHSPRGACWTSSSRFGSSYRHKSVLGIV